MSEPSIEDIERTFESCGEDTLRDFVEILLARNAELVAALERAKLALEYAGKDEIAEAIASIDAALAKAKPNA